MLILLLLGTGSALYIYNVSLLEGLSLLWFLLAGRKHVLQLFTFRFAQIGCLFLSALALFFSGLVNNTPFLTSLKGIGAYSLIPISVLYLVRSFSHKQIWWIFLVAQFASLYFLHGQDEEIVYSPGDLQDLFKFSLSGIFVAVFLTFFSFLPNVSKTFRRLYLSNYLTAILISVVGLWGNLRLLIFNSWISVFLANNGKARSSFFSNSSSFQTLYVAILLPLVILLLSLSSALLARVSIETLRILPEGFVSADTIDKTQSQMSGNFGLLFGGRMEIFSSVVAWLEKPLLGWGSWAIDPGNYFRIRGFEIMRLLNYDVDIDKVIAFYGKTINFFIPTHSALLNLLVWSGIIGAIPFYFFFSSYIQLFLSISLASLTPIPFYILFSFASSFWAILFSPLGFSNRTLLVINLSLVLSYCRCHIASSHRISSNQA